MGEATVYIGNEGDWMTTARTKIAEPFYSTGFRLTISDASGRYLKIRRTANSNDPSRKWYTVSKLLVY